MKNADVPASIHRCGLGIGWRGGSALRDGLTGHAEELYEDIGKSDWITRGTRGGQFAWERGPYYAKGLLSLAFALDDAELKARAKKWVDAYIASQRENGDFGPKNRNWWANMIVLWTLRDWCEATGAPRVVPFLERYFAFRASAIIRARRPTARPSTRHPVGNRAIPCESTSARCMKWPQSS